MNRSINYEQNRELEDNDIGNESSLYEITLYQRKYTIAIGKDRSVPERRNFYYVPVYLIYKGKVKSQIGAFEFESSEKNEKARIQPCLDKENDFDLNRLGGIVLYHFVDDMFMKQTESEMSPAELSELEYEYQNKKRKTEISIENGEKEDKDEEEDDFFNLTIPKNKISKQINSSDKLLKDGLFVLDKNKKLPETLLEETKEDSLVMKKEYNEKMSKKGTWVEKFMKNRQYDIVETESNGNCFFDAIRIAFSQIGYITTVDKLRALLSNEVTEELFDTYKTLFLNADGEKKEIENQMRIISKTNSELRKRMEKITETSERDKIRKNAKELIIKHDSLKEQLQNAKTMLNEFEFMRDVDSIEKLREVIKTTRY